MGRYSAIAKSAAYAAGTVAALGIGGYAGLKGMPLVEGAAFLGAMGTLTGSLMKAFTGDKIKNAASKVSPNGVVWQASLGKGMKIRGLSRQERLCAFYAETMNTALGLTPKNIFGKSIQYRTRTHDSILKVFEGMKKLGIIENLVIVPKKKKTRLVAEKILAGNAKLRDLFKGKKHYEAIFQLKTKYDVKFTVSAERCGLEEYKRRAEGDRLATNIIEHLEKSQCYSPVHKDGGLSHFTMDIKKVQREKPAQHEKPVQRAIGMRTKDKIMPIKGAASSEKKRRIDIFLKH